MARESVECRDSLGQGAFSITLPNRCCCCWTGFFLDLDFREKILCGSETGCYAFTDVVILGFLENVYRILEFQSFEGLGFCRSGSLLLGVFGNSLSSKF